VLAPGLRADVNVFALDEIALHDLTRVADLPGGDYRFTRPSAGFRATVVNGVPVVDDGAVTGARPGRLEAARTTAPS
jgi:N-acyl-D-aspartate/D-glutamate deacylase